MTINRIRSGPPSSNNAVGDRDARTGAHTGEHRDGSHRRKVHTSILRGHISKYAPMGNARDRHNRRSQPENILSLEGWWAQLVLSIQ
jgi:hypothetical protein